MLIDTYNTNYISSVQNNVISSTKSQSQSIPYFYKIVRQKQKSDTTKNTKIKTTKKITKTTKTNK